MDDVEKVARALCRSEGVPEEHWERQRTRALSILNEVDAFKLKTPPPTENEEEICGETDEYLDICVGVSGWQTADGRWIMEDDYRVAGEVWRVHKTDADPFPSRPHAHCVGGAKRFVGCKLHLGTAQLYHKNEPLGRFLARQNFDRLIELIRPKFPDLILPLPIT